MTTNTTNSQAASIRDDEQFMNELRQIADESIMQWPDWEAQIIAKFDAKLAKEREEGRRDSHETNMTLLNLKLRAEDRATAAEARLAEIQRGVEGLKTHRRHARILGTSMMNEENFYYVGDVLALLQPQGQADTSGLPG